MTSLSHFPTLLAVSCFVQVTSAIARGQHRTQYFQTIKPSRSWVVLEVLSRIHRTWQMRENRILTWKNRGVPDGKWAYRFGG
ncbi:hypothetical protein BGY98DRAFT_301919 [Russula aff. rugulosa BPL654]|nr:hypothetical protein BGY98DRAFT_301919 [Russula aff. rugulosa BPL654]